MDVPRHLLRRRRDGNRLGGLLRRRRRDHVRIRLIHSCRKCCKEPTGALVAPVFISASAYSKSTLRTPNTLPFSFAARTTDSPKPSVLFASMSTLIVTWVPGDALNKPISSSANLEKSSDARTGSNSAIAKKRVGRAGDVDADADVDAAPTGCDVSGETEPGSATPPLAGD